MPIAVQCKSCETKFRVPDSAAGGSVKCPQCSHRFRAPDATSISGSPEDQSSRKGRASSSSSKRPVLAEVAEDEGAGDSDSPALPTAPKAKRKTRTDDHVANDSPDREADPKRGMVRALMILSSVATLLVLCVLGLLWANGSLSKSKPEQEKRQEANQNLSRDQFRTLVIGKKEQQVLDALGKPAETQDQEGTKFWYYHNAAVDPVTGKKTPVVQIVFNGGSVTAVNFY